MKKNIYFVIACIVGVLLYSKVICGQEISGSKDKLDIIFVVDHSNSMNQNDKDKAGLEMVKAFIDTVHSEGIRIGYVAYNDKILSSTSPMDVASAKKRTQLKAIIDHSVYSGNTDIGLGLMYSYDLFEEEPGHKRVVVLISDGETDLNYSTTGRTVEDSNQDINHVVKLCKKKKIPIYTIAFGTQYDGSKEGLSSIAKRTGAKTYTAKTKEALIQVLYGIFDNNIAFTINEITDGIYGKGQQSIRYLLNESYLDEMDVLMISQEAIGKTTISYGTSKVSPSYLKHYAVAKLTEIQDNIQELTIHTTTSSEQRLKFYLISYRSLTPILNVNPQAEKNKEVPFSIYFKNKNGEKIVDEEFYEKFKSKTKVIMDETKEELPETKLTVKNGYLMGNLRFPMSGTYSLECSMDDSFENCVFGPVPIRVNNASPEGNLPENISYTIWSKDRMFHLDQYFSDPDGDPLKYKLISVPVEQAEIQLEEQYLKIKPKASGVGLLTFQVSDNEGKIMNYTYPITVIPLWKQYFWQLAAAILLILLLLWKIFHKKPTVVEKIAEKKAQYHFTGKLDGYFTQLPDNMEIPPLSFSLYKIKDKALNLGDLISDYKEVIEQLDLESVFFIPDEERKMILFHSSKSSVMIGSSIICRKIKYSIHYGDIIYFTSTDGKYELELHYIAMIQ